jgi:Meiotically up-regulated gene 113
VVRFSELSRQTGVPDDFIVIYDEIVADAKQVEELLHARFSMYRTRKNKEFFQIPPKEAIQALQEMAMRFPVSSTIPVLGVDLLPHFTKYFAAYLDPKVTSVRLVQLPGICYLEVTRQPKEGGPPITTQEELALMGILRPEAPTLDDLRVNETLVRSLDAYAWIMLSSLFPVAIAEKIAQEWERPGGKVERIRKRPGGNLYQT